MSVAQGFKFDIRSKLGKIQYKVKINISLMSTNLNQEHCE